MSGKKRGEIHEEHADESWLIPYADMLTLLLALFVVLYAMSNVDKAKFDALAAAFHTQIMEGGGLTFIPSLAPPDRTTQPMPPDEDEDEDAREQAMLEAMQESLQIYLEAAGLLAEVSTSIDQRGLVISMNNALFFESASADINPDYEGIIVQIGGMINRLDNYIRIEGHTDDMQINTERYPSNWELSGARASRVLRVFVYDSGIDPRKVSAVGYGEYKPVASNATAEGRQENRRVDVIVLSSVFNVLEGNVLR